MKKKKFEIKINRSVKPHKKAIFLDDELFDWEVDQESLEKAWEMGPEFLKAAQQDIQKHFLESLSDFLGRPVTAMQVAVASQTGWI